MTVWLSPRKWWELLAGLTIQRHPLPYKLTLYIRRLTKLNDLRIRVWVASGLRPVLPPQKCPLLLPVGCLSLGFTERPLFCPRGQMAADCVEDLRWTSRHGLGPKVLHSKLRDQPIPAADLADPRTAGTVETIFPGYRLSAPTAYDLDRHTCR